MKTIYNKIVELLTNSRGILTTMGVEPPRIIYIIKEMKEKVLSRHPNIKDLVSEDSDAETIIFVVSQVPSPYVDSDGKLHLGDRDFDNLMPFLMEFFSSHEKGIPINEAFNILIERLTG